MAGANLLFVERSDDNNVIYHLLKHYRIPVSERDRHGEPDKIKLEDEKGVENILNSLPVRLKPQDDDAAVARLGIVIDADDDLAARWQSVKAILRNAGYTNVPDVPMPEGTVIVEEGRIIFGIWLMPDNQLPGELEHFAQFLVKADDKLWVRANQCILDIPETDRLFTASDTIKAHVHTWLAWQSEPGKPMGQAITKKYFDANAPHAVQLIAWIRRLFAFTA